MSLGNNIKWLLELRGFTQAQLARAIRMSPAIVTKYCTDKSYPSFDVALRIAETLQVAVVMLSHPYQSKEELEDDARGYEFFFKVIQSMTGIRPSFEGKLDEALYPQILAFSIIQKMSREEIRKLDTTPDNANGTAERILKSLSGLASSDDGSSLLLSNKQKLLLHRYDQLSHDERKAVDSILFDPESLAKDSELMRSISEEKRVPMHTPARRRKGSSKS